eukprot:g20025.t1
MSGVNGGHQDVDIDLGRVFAAVWERKARILAVTVCAAAAALVSTSLMTPSYKGEARVLIEARSPSLSGAQGAPAGNDPVLDSLNITSQAQLLQSTDLIKRVTEELNLAQYKEFDPAGQSFLPDLLVMSGLKLDPMKLDPEDRVIKEFREKLEVYAVENSRVIAIEFSSHDPQLAAQIPNKMAEVYLDLQSGAKLDTHSQTAKWLQPEIADLTEKVKQAEERVADYRSRNGLFQTSETGSFSSQQLNDISNELARVRAERANAEAKAENVRTALKAGRQSDTLAEVVGSQVIQRLKEAEANLQAQISDQAIVLLEGHPRLKGLRAQLAGIRQQIDVETKKILGSLDSEADVARLRERQLIAQLNTLKADTARAGEEEVGLRALEREAAAQRQLLESYLSRYREATSKLGNNATPADARVVSQAVEPSEPYFPKVIPIVTVAALATLLVGCLVVIVAELFSGRALRPVGSGEEVAVRPSSAGAARASTPAPVPARAGETPAAVVVAEAPVAAAAVRGEDRPSHSPSAAAEPADESFTIGSVARYLQRHDVPVALVVSPGGDEGSTATVMLARAVAEGGRTVILIDLAGSACPTRLMAEHDRLSGITDLLCGESAFGDAIHRDRLSDAHIIPQGTSDPARAMRAADRLTMIIDALSEAYDLVVIECGAADIDGLRRLARGGSTELVLSVPGFSDGDMAGMVTTYGEAGFANVLIMSQSDQHADVVLDMPRQSRRLERNRATIRLWLAFVLLTLFCLVLVGGATRLTGSGLSITEWKPIHGVVPPLNAGEWQEEFELYKRIPQYQQLNSDMTIEDFKSIFWWEWAHRFLARSIGIVFALPLLFFWATGRIEKRLRWPLVGVLALGGFQGFIGWWMVSSGLTKLTSVSQYRLATHLTIACLIFAACVWIMRGLSPHSKDAPPTAKSHWAAGAIAILVLVQIYLGALVAGLDAGLSYNTWPLMDGSLIPGDLFVQQPGWINLFENPKTVQFVHRCGAYLLWAAVLLHMMVSLAKAPDTTHARRSVLLFVLVSVQALIGISTLVMQVPLHLALTHQAAALVVLGFAIAHWRGFYGEYDRAGRTA